MRLVTTDYGRKTRQKLYTKYYLNKKAKTDEWQKKNIYESPEYLRKWIPQLIHKHFASCEMGERKWKKYHHQFQDT